ncbi:hypothetical protein [Caballeronia sp. LZ043]|nr:hypothetical protein [Caballeronia sp. LZ043]MDR5824731.1 hypothetical protein [Caballeronia sp. LZ043]
MKLWQIWGIILIVAGAYLLLCSEMDYRAARIERCAVVHCA